MTVRTDVGQGRCAGGANEIGDRHVMYRSTNYGAIRVFWTPELDGGGMTFGQTIIPVVERLFGRVGRVFEMCAGPGFIGFSLLARGLCDSLCLADVDAGAVAAVRKTIADNGLADRVTVYQADSLTDIPTDEQWDLVVGNPPHFHTPPTADSYDRIGYDPGWRLHESFYGEVRRHLRPQASVLLLENSMESSAGMFEPMMERGGMELVKTFMLGSPLAPLATPHYFVWSRPSWSNAVDLRGAPTFFRLTTSQLGDRLMLNNERTQCLAHLDIVDDSNVPLEVWVESAAHAARVFNVVPGERRRTRYLVLPPGEVWLSARRRVPDVQLCEQ